MRLKISMPLLCLFFIIGCGSEVQKTSAPEEKRSAAFIPWHVSQNCIIRHSLKEKIKVCIRGNGNHKIAQEKSFRAIRLWLDAIRPLNEDVTDELELSCVTPHATVTVQPGSAREMAGPGWVNVYDRSAFGSYLHEFGHAFACLADTYYGGMAGACVQGQPHSVMCDGLLVNQLSQDDIRGVQAQFKSTFGN